MKIRYLLLAAPMIFGYASLTNAARMELNNERSSHQWHSEHDAGHDNHVWRHEEPRGDDSNHQWQNSWRQVKHTEHNWSHSDHHYDFKDYIKALVKNQYQEHNVYLNICKNEPSGHGFEHGFNPGHGGHQSGNGNWGSGGNNGSGGANAVPVPAAVWLFAPGLLGLLGFKRKQA